MANACCEQIAQKFDKMISDIKRLPLDKKPTGVLDVTTNGTYDAPDNIKGYNRVNVNVPSTAPPVLDTLDVTANGQYTPPAGTDGYDEVNVNVPIPTFTTQEKTATANGDVTPDAGYDGLSKVVVAVPSDINNEDVTFAANGEYNPAPPYSGFGKVTVNVPDVPAVTQSLDVTANGTYTPPSGVDGFDEVTVNVPDVPAVVEQLSVTANGTYTPPSGVDGYNEVTVNVPIPTFTTQEKTATANGDVTPDAGYDGLSKVVVEVPTPQMSLDVTRYYFSRINPQTKNIIATGRNSIFAGAQTSQAVIPISAINGNNAMFLAEAFIFINDYTQNNQPVLVNDSTILNLHIDINYNDPSRVPAALIYPMKLNGDYYINTPTATPAPNAFYRVLFAANASTVLDDVLLDSDVESITISNVTLEVIYTKECVLAANTGVIVNLINGE